MMTTEQKYERLQAVFLKAIDSSVNSIDESDLQESFGDLKQQLGNNLQMAFMNMISRSEKRMENEFTDITSRHDIKRYLLKLKNLHLSADAPSTEIGESERLLLLETKKAIIKAEIEELTCATKTLEGEIKRSGDAVGRLRTQLYNEIEALNEQSMKLERVNEHCT
jgi:hypothetical protein